MADKPIIEEEQPVRYEEEEEDVEYDPVPIRCPHCDEEELRLQPFSSTYHICGNCHYEEWR